MDCLLTWIYGQLELKNKTDNETNGIIRERESKCEGREREVSERPEDGGTPSDRGWRQMTRFLLLMSRWFANSQWTHRSQEGRHYYEHRHSVTSGRRHRSKMKQMWDERDSWPLKGQFSPNTLICSVFHSLLFILDCFDVRCPVCQRCLSSLECNWTKWYCLVGRKLKMAALLSLSRNRDPVSKKNKLHKPPGAASC